MVFFVNLKYKSLSFTLIYELLQIIFRFMEFISFLVSIKQLCNFFHSNDLKDR